MSEMEEFGNISKKLQELEIETLEAGLKRIPNTTKEVSEKSYPKFEKLIDIIEDDDDVQKVYHNAILNEA
jgi:transcriptional/translational regulatory protein YebC/TACO1